MKQEYTLDYLFICYANVGRSQIAEGIYNHYIPEKSISAGIADFKEKYHSKPHPGVIRVMNERGIDISHQQIKILTQEMVKQAKQIVTFHNINKCPEYIKNSSKTMYIMIEDPGIKVSGPEHINENILQDFRNTRDKIEQVIYNLISGKSIK